MFVIRNKREMLKLGHGDLQFVSIVGPGSCFQLLLVVWGNVRPSFANSVTDDSSLLSNPPAKPTRANDDEKSAPPHNTQQQTNK